MLALAPIDAVAVWEGYEGSQFQCLEEFLLKLPDPQRVRVCQAPFGDSRCLVLWGSAGCGASLLAARIESDGLCLECLAILTQEIDLAEGEYSMVYETDSELLGWVHMPSMQGKWILIDPICPAVEALPEGLPLEFESPLNLCASIRLYFNGNDLAQLHLLLTSESGYVRQLLGPDYCSGVDKELPRLPFE